MFFSSDSLLSCLSITFCRQVSGVPTGLGDKNFLVSFSGCQGFYGRGFAGLAPGGKGLDLTTRGAGKMTTGHRTDMTRFLGRYDGIDPIWRAKTKKAGEHIVSYSFVTVFHWMDRRWGHRSAIGLKRINPFLFPMSHGTLKGWGSQLLLFKGNQTPDQKL